MVTPSSLNPEDQEVSRGMVSRLSFEAFWEFLVHSACGEVSDVKACSPKIRSILALDSSAVRKFVYGYADSGRTERIVEECLRQLEKEDKGAGDKTIDMQTFVRLCNETQLPEEQDDNPINQTGKAWKGKKLTTSFKRPPSKSKSEAKPSMSSASSPTVLSIPVPLPVMRVIARLDIKGPHVSKGICMEGIRSLGSPAEFARNYFLKGADEIAYIDLVASLYEKGRTVSFLKNCMEKGIHIPLCVGGGIRSISDIALLLRSGADKVAINTQAIKNPKLITDASRYFGAQCIVGQIDCKLTSTSESKEGVVIESGYEALYDCGRERSYKDAVKWAEELQNLGCGELLVTSIDRDGKMQGPDLKLCSMMLRRVSIPVVFSGGIATRDHVTTLLAQCDPAALPSGLAIASALHYGQVEIGEIKESLQLSGVPTRPIAPATISLCTSIGNLSRKKIAIIDYGMGNLASVVAALCFLGFGCEVVSRGEDFLSGHFDVAILPGVGAFQEAMSKLRERGLIEAIRKHYDGGVGKIFGICLGAQLMLDSSEEFGFCEGLGLMKGRSVKFEPTDAYSSMTIPHIGWSTVRKHNEIPFWTELPVEMHMYFDHSFHFADVQSCFECNYAGRRFSAAFANAEGSVIGVQFHPEKSGDFGLALLQKFLVA